MPKTTSPGTRHRIGAREDFPQGEFRLVELGGRTIAVVCTSKGLFAVRDKCPHMGAPLSHGKVGGAFLPCGRDALEYGLEDQVVRCPWHNWEFDLGTGEAIGGITGKRLVTYAIDSTPDGVFITVRGAPTTSP
jgi:nitrite reductase (NADH) small subunit